MGEISILVSKNVIFLEQTNNYLKEKKRKKEKGNNPKEIRTLEALNSFV